MRSRMDAIFAARMECGSAVIVSPGWPGHVSTAEQVNVQMRNGLPTILIAIDDQAIPSRQTELLSKLRSHQLEVAEDHLILHRGVIERANHLFGDDQYVRWGLRSDIVEGQAEFVFVCNLCGNRFIDNLEEDVVGEHGCLPSE